MQRDEEDIDVLECALLIARHAHPDLVRHCMLALGLTSCLVHITISQLVLCSPRW